MNANKNRSKKSGTIVQGAIAIALALSLLVVVQAVMAEVDPTLLDLAGFRVKYLGTTGTFVGATNVTTWTYQIVIKPEWQKDISHISFGMNSDCVIAGASSSEKYPPEYTDEGAASVLWNGNPVVKFETPTGTPVTTTFALVVENVAGPDNQGTYVGVMSGKPPMQEGYLYGPDCSTTAVELSDIHGRSSAGSQLVISALGLATVTALSAVVYRKKRV